MARRKAETAVHPTKQRLLDTAVDMLQATMPANITLDDVLATSGVSSGSLYHHFRDFPDLMDHAFVVRYAQFARSIVERLSGATVGAVTVHDYRANLLTTIDAGHGPHMAPVRASLVWILGHAAARPELRELLAVEQDRLTAELADVVRDVQARGWARPELDPHVVAVFLQAYSLGAITDDVAHDHMDVAGWKAFIEAMVVRTILVMDEPSGPAA